MYVDCAIYSKQQQAKPLPTFPTFLTIQYPATHHQPVRPLPTFLQPPLLSTIVEVTSTRFSYSTQKPINPFNAPSYPRFCTRSCRSIPLYIQLLNIFTMLPSKPANTPIRAWMGDGVACPKKVCKVAKKTGSDAL